MILRGSAPSFITPVLLLVACAAPASGPAPSSLPPPTAPTSNVAADAGAPIPADAATHAAACDGDDFGLPRAAEAEVAPRFAKKRGTMGIATKQIVATSHHLATEAGLAVLRSGGNAADAFVAATLVQDVVLPGVTSTAGLTAMWPLMFCTSTVRGSRNWPNSAAICSGCT